MKKILVLLFAAISLNLAQAQSGNNQLGIGLDIGLPLGDFGDVSNVGIGGSAKLLLGVGTAGQVTFTSGYTYFKAKDMLPGWEGSSSIIPLLLGYRHNFSGVYLEPQAGYGIYGGKVTYQGTSTSDSEGAFTWAIGAGYAMNPGLDLGVRFQSATKDGETNNLIGFSVRWNFLLGAGPSR